jgi:EAL and modified HD-GYP domain-containing signal transduction protein
MIFVARAAAAGSVFLRMSTLLARDDEAGMLHASEAACEPRYLARQPILNREREVVAYELLFRDGPENAFRGGSIPSATSSVIADAFLMVGLDALSGGRPVYVNFSRESLLEEVPLLLPPSHLVVELLETIEPDERVVRACRALKARGYTLALDDFAWSEAWRPLVELADIVKLDFLATRGAERARTIARLRRYRTTLLAEKVEHHQDVEDALRLGCALFQGYFFHKPTMLSMRGLAGLESSHLRVLRAISSASCDLRTVEDLVRRDLSLTYKLLRRASSPVFGESIRTGSLRRALQVLGLDEVRRWVALLVVAGLSKGQPAELTRAALLRARFCEAAAPAFGLAERGADLFLMGLFSVLETILGRPLGEILGELALEPELQEALRLDGRSSLARPLRCAIAWERGDWDAVDAISSELPARGDGLPEAYVGALEWLRESEALIEA